MLKTITSLRSPDGYARLYQITDTYFTEEISLDTSKFSLDVQRGAIPLIAPEWAVISLYGKKGLPIASNVARMYLAYNFRIGHDRLPPSTLQEQVDTFTKRIRNFATKLDEVFPEFRYSELYLECVLRHLNEMRWGYQAPTNKQEQ